MFSPGLYIIVCSARNRLRARLARLREPRYLVGALAGAAYLYFSFFARLRGSSAAARRRRAAVPASGLVFAALWASAPAMIAVGLLAVGAVSWLIPLDSGLLDFSEAETAFLIPAPVSRRGLILYRLTRSQLGLLFGAIVMGLVAPSVTGFTRLRIAVAMWVLLLAGKVYATGVTLTRARLRTHPPARDAARLPIVLAAAAAAIVVGAVALAFWSAPIHDLADAIGRLDRATSSGLPGIVLWPFAAIARPFTAAWPGAYLRALASASVVLAALTAWVLRTDEAFQEAAAAAAQKRAASAAAQASAVRARGIRLPLRPIGRPEAAFAWKAALQTLRIADRRSIARLIAFLVGISVLAVSTAAARGFAAVLCIFAVSGAAFCLVMAPQALRIDMRQDLGHLELLKTWPVAASALVRGEILWPGALVTVTTWTLIGLALFLSGAVFKHATLDLRMVVAAAAAIVAPAIVFAQLAIQNGIALMFPAWVPLGTQRARGLDAMGQRLILLGGTLLLLIVMLLPGAIAAGLVWFAAWPLAGAAAALPAAFVASAIVAIEVLLATEMLGPVYERLDLTAVERVE